MKPSSLRTRTTSSFILDIGTSTRSCWRTFELRMRVSRSEIGSIFTLHLPGRFFHARQQAAVSHLAETHAAEAEIAVERAGTAADLAAVAVPRRELRDLHHLCAPSCRGHGQFLPAAAA